MTPGTLGLALLIGAGTVVAAIVAARVAHGVGLPSLLVFLGIGLLLGEGGIGIKFDDATLAETLGLAGLVLILAEGGLTTNWAHARRAAPVAIALATVGVVASIAIAAGLTHWLLGLGWREALLLGAVLAPTDAAAVFSVLRRLPLPPRLSGMLEGESGLNDPPSVIAVTLLSVRPGGHSASAVEIVAEVGWELIGGAAIGIAFGLLGMAFLRKVALPATGLYPVAVLALVVIGYGAADLVHASGFLAVYAAAVMLGNARLPHGPATRGFAEGVGWLAQIGLFVMLGLLASPSRLPPEILPALAVGVILVMLARPLSVAIATLPFRVPLRQQAFLSWAGLRGAVPVVLATIPLSQHVPGATKVFDQVFVIVVAFTLIQGPSLPWVARRLGVTAPAEPLEIIVDAAPLDDLHADLLQAFIPDDSKLHGVEVFELRLPAEASIALVVRDGKSLVPGPDTRLLRGDRLLIVVPEAVRPRVERRLRAVSRAGKLAGWLGEHGDEDHGRAGAPAERAKARGERAGPPGGQAEPERAGRRDGVPRVRRPGRRS